MPSSATTRRSFLRYAALAAATPILTEAHLAAAARAGLRAGPDSNATPKPRPMRLVIDPPPAGAILIDSNENPLGPCQSARTRIIELTPSGGRYDLYGETLKLTEAFAAQHNLKPEYISVHAGSTVPLNQAVLAFTSPTRSYVTADPSYEMGMMAASLIGAPVHKVPLTSAYAHDVNAMVSADPNAGLLYICNPNNPTGTLTSREDIIWALDHKPKGSILLVDEAYIHFADTSDVLDLVAADKDLIVLRTFSKVYGMAGLRCGLALARPDLQDALARYGINFMPITGSGAARASLLETDLVATRKKINTDVREETIAWLEQHHYKVIAGSQANCFMIDTGRDGHGVMHAMQEKNVYIGRVWPIWPHAVRITVGTPQEMATFRTAFQQVMDAPPVVAEVHAPFALRRPFS